MTASGAQTLAVLGGLCPGGGTAPGECMRAHRRLGLLGELGQVAAGVPGRVQRAARLARERVAGGRRVPVVVVLRARPLQDINPLSWSSSAPLHSTQVMHPSSWSLERGPCSACRTCTRRHGPWSAAPCMLCRTCIGCRGPWGAGPACCAGHVPIVVVL